MTSFVGDFSDFFSSDSKKKINIVGNCGKKW